MVTINSNSPSSSVALDVNVLHHQGDVISDVLRPIGKDIIPVSSATNQQSFTAPLGHERLAPQGDLHNATESVTTIGQTEGEQQQEVQQPNTTTEGKDQSLKEQPNDHSTAVSNSNIHSSHLEKSNVEEMVTHHSVLRMILKFWLPTWSRMLLRKMVCYQ